jgi:ATP-binding cassette subfamily F protein 3
MLNIHNLSVSFGGTFLFEEVTFRLGAGDRVGLVGKNGAGKSTMLKILAGDFAPDSGVISQEKEIRMGFLRQDIDFERGRTVLEEAYEAFVEIKIVEKKLEQINHQLVTRTDYESEEYTKIIEDLGDYTH